MSNAFSPFTSARQTMARPVAADSLAVVRIGFGLAMAWTALSLLEMFGQHPFTLERLALAEFQFKYSGFSWIRAATPSVMEAFGAILFASSIFLAIGYRPRVAAAIVFLTWTYVFLVEAANYNNHYYLQSLLAFLLIWMPSDRAFRAPLQDSKPRTIPFACIVLLRFQLIVVYFFGGVAKINSDYLFRGEPVRSFIEGSRLESIAPWAHTPASVFGIAYAGLLFDLLIGPMLLWQRTRLLAFMLAAAFHGVNHFLLFDDIALFPLLALCLTTVFFAPDWPTRWLRKRTDFLVEKGPASATQPLVISNTAFVVGWMAFQLLLPLRPILIPGNAAWTGQGATFSWRMKEKGHEIQSFQIQVSGDPAPAPPRFEIVTQWNQIPLERWIAISEPPVGQRLVWFGERAPANNNQSGQATGNSVAARSVEDCLRSAIAELDDRAPKYAARLRGAIAFSERMTADDERQGKLFHQGLQRIVNEPIWGELTLRQLQQAIPGSFRGEATRSLCWLSAVGQNQQQPPKPTTPIFVFERDLAAGYWHKLPVTAVVRFSGDEEKLIWNAFAELNDAQIARMVQQPSLTHDYAQHIARRWQKEYDESPRVFVHCRTSMNKRPVQWLYDPSVDLTSVKYSWCQPNRWVMPLLEAADEAAP